VGIWLAKLPEDGRLCSTTISRRTRAMTEFLTRTRIGRLDAEQARLLDHQGYLL
jgi:hypothetical protein